MNKLDAEIVGSPFEKQDECAKFTIEDVYVPFIFNDVIAEIGVGYVFSFWIKSETDGLISLLDHKCQTTKTWEKYEIPVEPYDKNLKLFFDKQGVYYLYNAQLEIGSRATAYRPAEEDVEDAVANAAGTATNYLYFDEKGLVVGNHTANSLGRNILLTSETVDIRNGNTILASYGDDEIHLGVNSVFSAIYMCGDVGRISAELNEDTGLYNRLVFSAQDGAAEISGRAGVSMISEEPDYFDMIARTVIGSYGSVVRAQAATLTQDRDFINLSWINLYPNEIDMVVQKGKTGRYLRINMSSYDSEIFLSRDSETWTPYYKPGDSIIIEWKGAGYISAGKEKLLFSIPLAKQAIGCTGVTVSSHSSGGLIIRQGGEYCYGSTSGGGYVQPNSYVATLQGGNHVVIDASMSGTANANNNSSAGIQAYIIITFH